MVIKPSQKCNCYNLIRKYYPTLTTKEIKENTTSTPQSVVFMRDNGLDHYGILENGMLREWGTFNGKCQERYTPFNPNDKRIRGYYLPQQ